MKIVIVPDDQRAVGQEGDAMRAAELSRVGAVGPELTLEGAVAIQHLYAVIVIVGNEELARRTDRDTMRILELPVAGIIIPETGG